MLQLPIMLLCAYLLGSISTAITLSKLFNLNNPRATGSKNPGATNMLRVNGISFAALTLLGDLSKGMICMMLAKSLGLTGYALTAIALSTFIGHVFPIYYQFKGGKGVAVSLGIILGYAPILALLTVLTWCAALLCTRYSSLSALIAAPSAALMSLYWKQPPLTLTLGLISLILILTHRHNIQKLLNGSEKKILTNCNAIFKKNHRNHKE